VSDVALALLQQLDFRVIHVEAEATEAGVREGTDERQANVTQSNDANTSGTGGDFCGEFGGKLGSLHSECSCGKIRKRGQYSTLAAEFIEDDEDTPEWQG
jgi:hypothetical protein